MPWSTSYHIQVPNFTCPDCNNNSGAFTWNGKVTRANELTEIWGGDDMDSGIKFPSTDDVFWMSNTLIYRDGDIWRMEIRCPWRAMGKLVWKGSLSGANSGQAPGGTGATYTRDNVTMCDSAVPGNVGVLGMPINIQAANPGAPASSVAGVALKPHPDHGLWSGQPPLGYYPVGMAEVEAVVQSIDPADMNDLMRSTRPWKGYFREAPCGVLLGTDRAVPPGPPNPVPNLPCDDGVAGIKLAMGGVCVIPFRDGQGYTGWLLTLCAYRALPRLEGDPPNKNLAQRVKLWSGLRYDIPKHTTPAGTYCSKNDSDALASYPGPVTLGPRSHHVNDPRDTCDACES